MRLRNMLRILRHHNLQLRVHRITRCRPIWPPNPTILPSLLLRRRLTSKCTNTQYPFLPTPAMALRTSICNANHLLCISSILQIHILLPVFRLPLLLHKAHGDKPIHNPSILLLNITTNRHLNSNSNSSSSMYNIPLISINSNLPL